MHHAAVLHLMPRAHLQGRIAIHPYGFLFNHCASARSNNIFWNSISVYSFRKGNVWGYPHTPGLAAR